MSYRAIFVPTRLPHWGFHLVYRLVQSAFFLFARVQVTGRENFPATGSFIFATNHLSSLDTGLGLVVIQSELASRSVIFAGDTWRRNRLTRIILQLANVIWVHRGQTSPSTIKTAIRVLRDGYVLGIAPEGTRSRESHALIKGHPGAAFLALAANVPIVPIAITNMENLWPSMKRVRRIDITATVGKPFTLAPCPDSSHVDHVCLRKSTDEIMCRIAVLLPPNYRGEYIDHPRLRELQGTS